MLANVYYIFADINELAKSKKKYIYTYALDY
jgi:hypothetical protein